MISEPTVSTLAPSGLIAMAPPYLRRVREDMGRYGEMWGDVGRYGDVWGGMGRYGEIWGDVGMYAAPEDEHP